MAVVPTLAPVAVLDASVALLWVLAQPGRATALHYLDAFESGRLDLIAPRLLPHEVASALAKHCRRREISLREAEQAFRWIETRSPRVQDGDSAAALGLALRLQLSYWDCCYLALAMDWRCDLITADERLFRGARRHYPFITLVGVEQ